MLDDLQNAAANALPPHREDEPPALRQEILDELSDHFACAYRRELLRTRGDAELSKRNVRDRFGDPAKIARKLWLDAMKGKLMAQKFMVFATCLSVVLMAAIAFMGWRLVEASQQATSALIARSQETSAALLAQSEKTHAAILARLEAQSKDGGADWGDSLEWSEFELQFVEEGTGKPATDVTVNVSGPNGETSSGVLQRFNNQHPDSKGAIALAPLHIGQYSVNVQTSWGASFHETVNVRPGHDFQKIYRVPAKPEMGKVDLEIEWPDRLRGRDLWAIVGLWQNSSKVIDNMRWSAGVPRYFAVHTDGRIVDLGEFYNNRPTIADSLAFGGLGGGFGGGMGGMGGGIPTISNQVAQAAFNAGRSYEPGLGEVFAGTWMPLLLGVYPEPILPREISTLDHDSVWIGINRTREQLEAEAENPGTVGPSTLPYAYDTNTKSVPPGGEAIHGGVIYQHPGPGELVVNPDTTSTFTITIPEEVAAVILEDMLPPRTPVQAPQFPTYADPHAERNLWPSADLIVECVMASDGKPLAGVDLQLGRPDLPGPFLSDTLGTTNANGRVDFGTVPPGKYSLRMTLPWEERLWTGTEFVVEGPDPVTKTITCPASAPPRTTAAYNIHWPRSISRDDLWLVLELDGELRRKAGKHWWSSSGWHLVAIHRDGRTVAWTQAAGPYFSYHSLEELPAEERLTKFVNAYATQGSEKPVSPMLLEGAHFQILGAGIARWDGAGPPHELLAGIRNGRYVSLPKGHFFYLLREIAPMKAKEELPTLTMNQSDEGQPTLEYTVPESLVQSALRRWDGLPVASK